ncbi:MAG: DUF2442 domain-containing protein [Candidatus Hydrogenedens sp.]|nr:DUF2442 domain-containing protein [Candidatus Hydrogenedens sp.]
MAKAHEVKVCGVVGTELDLLVDGEAYLFDLASVSSRLARATPQQLANLEVSPGGYGLYWPEVDEDLSIDGLLREHSGARKVG